MQGASQLLKESNMYGFAGSTISESINAFRRLAMGSRCPSRNQHISRVVFFAKSVQPAHGRAYNRIHLFSMKPYSRAIAAYRSADFSKLKNSIASRSVSNVMVSVLPQPKMTNGFGAVKTIAPSILPCVLDRHGRIVTHRENDAQEYLNPNRES